MHSFTLAHIAVFLAAAAIAAPLAKVLRIGTVLGYIFAGVLIGPYGLGRLTGIGIGDASRAEDVLHFAEFGVVLLLFLIGLELRIPRLWAMRSAIFGAGGAQVGLTGLALGGAGVALGVDVLPALFLGLALSLSSTAFALQVMEENRELTLRHGRLGFAVLLFQDLAAIPLIALASLFAVKSGANGASGFAFAPLAKAVFTIAALVLASRFLLDHAFRLVAATRIKEALTAAALLVVVGVVLIMEWAGLSASLGAFLAGVVLADSAYRHEIEADIKPFEGLLLGLFFTAIGMSLDVRLIASQPLLILALVLGVVAIKIAILMVIGAWQRLEARPARRLALSLSQGGEFAFVLVSAGVAAQLLSQSQAGLTAVVVTVSMILTPALLLLESWWHNRHAAAAQPAYDAMPVNEGHVIVAGFGRFGQIVTRVLRARRIPFTALDIDPTQIALVQRFGAKSYYGDASRPEILEAAQIDKARAFVLAIDDIDASLRTAELVRRLRPDLPVYARARNRNHVHRLMDLGVNVIHRETFLAALSLTGDLLRGLGVAKDEAATTIAIFTRHDEKRLVEDYAHYTDQEKMRDKALQAAEELEQLLEGDTAAQAVAAGEASPVRRERHEAETKR
jgi:glutathione-regulated potassium-efflux system protein KefB